MTAVRSHLETEFLRRVLLRRIHRDEAIEPFGAVKPEGRAQVDEVE